MANIDSMNMKDGKIVVKLEMSKDEYAALNHYTKNLLLLPTELRYTLTTGKLGNSNRIMLPNKLLRKYMVEDLLKKAPSDVFDLGTEKFLLIKLQESILGKPVFGDKK
ncbi:MAG: hypothetical protein JW700_03625 [Candidatus Aenigmarchaeota archaeon]|nr:hypothetical protein [Candidatus Aenigmarchaeota archaeon]